MKIPVVALAVLLWAAPVFATPFSVTFSGTITAASPLFPYWIPRFDPGAALEGLLIGDTELHGPPGPPLQPGSVLSFTVAGHTFILGPKSFLVSEIGPNNEIYARTMMNGLVAISPTVPGLIYDDGVWLDIGANGTGNLVFGAWGWGPNGFSQNEFFWASITKTVVSVPEPSTLWFVGAWHSRCRWPPGGGRTSFRELVPLTVRVPRGLA
jgi:hypothetical protein